MEVTNPVTGARLREHLPDPANTTPTRQFAPGRDPGRLARATSGSRSAASARRSTWAWPRATSILLASSGNFGVNFMKGLLRRLAPGHGADGDRRLRRHVPELAGGPADDDRLLRRRPGGLRASWSISPARAMLGGGPFESLIRLLDARQPDDATWRRPLAVVIAKTLDSLVMPVMSRAGLHRPQLPGARRQQHGGRRLRRELGADRRRTCSWPWPTPCRSPSPDTSS